MKYLPLLPLSLLVLTALYPGPGVEKNFARVNNRLYIQKTEVSNGEYQDFLDDLKAAGKMDEYRKFRCDSSQWRLKTPIDPDGFWEKKYHADRKFAAYPVVNITHEAAQAYGEWLTRQYLKEEKRPFPNVVIRLPSETEWKMIALTAQAYAVNPDVTGKKQRKKRAVANLKTGDTPMASTKSPITFKVGESRPNKLGLYNMLGNVSEMTRSGGLKGGSWDNKLEECAVNKVQNFLTPDPRVGFRLVMEVVE